MRSVFFTSSISRDAGWLFFSMTSLGRSQHGLGVDIMVHGVQDTHCLEYENGRVANEANPLSVMVSFG